MTTHTFQCPSCGAPLLPRGNATVISCPHCHTSVVVPEELREDTASEWTTLVFDNFMSSDHHWLVGSYTSEYFAPLNQTIADGRYRWDGKVIKTSSISTTWLVGYQLADFHLMVNAKHVTGSKEGSSQGIIFRVQDNRNYYFFHCTDSQLYAVSIVRDGQWQHMVDWTGTDAFKPNGVNQLEVIANASHFLFLINGQVLCELENDEYSRGRVGIAVEGYTAGEAIVFDFLDFTLRGPRGHS